MGLLEVCEGRGRMTERCILTGVAWADMLLCWHARIVVAGMILAGAAGILAIIWGLIKRGDGH